MDFDNSFTTVLRKAQSVVSGNSYWGLLQPQSQINRKNRVFGPIWKILPGLYRGKLLRLIFKSFTRGQLWPLKKNVLEAWYLPSIVLLMSINQFSNRFTPLGNS